MDDFYLFPFFLFLELFEIYAVQASRMRNLNSNEVLGKVESIRVIELDLPRTFPALSFFQPGGPMHSELRYFSFLLYNNLTKFKLTNKM